MNIYTITCSNAYNYGAVLQAYALQKYLEKLGHNAVLIDYHPPYLRKISDKYKNKIAFKAIRAILYAPDYTKSKRVFGNFKKKIKSTEKTFYLFNELRHIPKADIYIAGSDQIWNPFMKNGCDPAYYLEFASGKKIAFAASIGCSLPIKKYGEYYRKKLSGFSAVTVRENETKLFLNKLGIKAECVLDPVYLLNKSEWESICENSEKRKYIVVYALHHIQAIYDYARKLADSYNAKMYVISVELKEIKRGNDKFFWNPKIEKFLSLIKNAEAVVTNSFHGVSFGLIFNRPLHIFDTEYNDLRIKNVIDIFGLEDRLCDIGVTKLLDDSMPAHAYTRMEEEIRMTKVKLKEILED